MTLKLSQRLIYFIAIGATAALVHILSVINLVNHFNLQPLIANIFAFLIAFNVSYLGHKYLTFSHMVEERELSLPHFFVVASSAGLLNEFLYFVLLEYTSVHYIAGLILVLGLVSVYSFILSRYWACR